MFLLYLKKKQATNKNNAKWQAKASRYDDIADDDKRITKLIIKKNANMMMLRIIKVLKKKRKRSEQNFNEQSLGKRETIALDSLTVAKIKVVLFVCVHMYTASKRIELESPG